MADWDGFPRRRRESELRGIGQYLEVTSPPAREMGGIRFEDDGMASGTAIVEGADKVREAGITIAAHVPEASETGVAEVVRYGMVNDFGVIVNPMLVEGQAHGGIVQGIGQCFLEHVVYDEGGQPVTGSYMDYALPRANDAPFFTFAPHPVPAKTNVLGAKGCGDAGCAGSVPSVMNALVDALSIRGITHIDMPATIDMPAAPSIWKATQAARGNARTL